MSSLYIRRRVSPRAFQNVLIKLRREPRKPAARLSALATPGFKECHFRLAGGSPYC
jgi:hypothetical protein